MRRVGAYEAKVKLAEILRHVEKGERFVITRHGVPVAVIAPVSVSQKDVKDAIQALEAFARERSLQGLTLRELIEEGRTG